MRRAAWAAGAAVIIGLSVPSGAGAAVTVGQTFPPTETCSGGFSFTAIQTGSSIGPYDVPSAGVITSWSWQSSESPPNLMRLIVVRSAGGQSYLTVGVHEKFEAPVANSISTYPARIPVQAGDLIGIVAGSSGDHECNSQSNAATWLQSFETTPPGQTATYNGPLLGEEFPISAQLEPDADNDGFGDETQDLCPTDALSRSDCIAPDTGLTKTPKKKSKKKRATFEFGSAEPGSTFRCSVRGGPFSECSSPLQVKAKKGRNTFTVFAVDAAGNADDSPATYSWKYKKKRKKRR